MSENSTNMQRVNGSLTSTDMGRTMCPRYLDGSDSLARSFLSVRHLVPRLSWLKVLHLQQELLRR